MADRYFGMFCTILLALLLIASITGASASADEVVPSERATSGVNIRERANADSRSLGVLKPGGHAELTGSVPYWYRVRLPNGKFGYVSKAWTELRTGAAVANAEFTLHGVDVGTGLALIIEGKDFLMVYDGGSNDDLARGEDNRLLDYLKAALPNRARIDQLILSHPHRDHVELLADLFDKYEIKNVWDTGVINTICGYRAFITAISNEPGVVYRSAHVGPSPVQFLFPEATCYGKHLGKDTIALPNGGHISNEPIIIGQGATMTFLYVDGTDYHGQYNRNSLVVRLDLGDKRVLIMGDAEAGGRAAPAEDPKPDSIEGALVACCIAALHADVLIVGHHGSKTSSRQRFINAVGASVFIVSSGPKKYGSVTLPDSEIIDELESKGAIFRSDRDDDACKTNPAKIGPDDDDRAGGCDNIRVTIKNGTAVSADYWHGSD